MATFAKRRNPIVTKLLLLFLLVALIHVSDVRAETRIKDKAILKTIQAKSGDIFDCYLIHKQPSLRHPSMKGHKIQMRPSSLLRNVRNQKIEKSSLHVTLPTVECPLGTVPVLRTKEFEGPYSSDVPRNFSTGVNTENAEFYAARGTTTGTYYGAQASLGIWTVNDVKPDQQSGATLWVGEIARSDINDMMSVGWMVSHEVYNDNKTRLTLRWTATGKGSCYNTRCPGFVQSNQQIAFGGTFPNVSDYDVGLQYYLTVTISKDPVTHAWYLFVGDDMTEVGYWPAGFFPHLSASAPMVLAGGFAISPKNENSPPMGNGRFPAVRSGYISSTVKNIRTADLINRFVNPSQYFRSVFETSYLCYRSGDLRDDHDSGMSFDYGGPGTCTID